MRILWIVNFIFPDVADELGIPRNISGGWLLDLSRQIAKQADINLAIVCMYSGKDLKDYKLKGIQYFLIPGGGKKAMFYSSSLLKYWEIIDSKVNPDIVHLHGTEFTHGEVYLDNFQNRKFLLTLQGMLGSVAREATAYVPFSVQLFGRTADELLHFNSMTEVKIMFKKNAKHERSIIQKVDYVTGRTFWDECLVESINPDAKYFKCFFNLREEFYAAPKWTVEKIVPKTIYAGTSAQLPYKGGHIVVTAFNEVLRRHPDARLKLMLKTDSTGKPIASNGYQKYVLRLIDRMGTREHIDFLPPQNAQGVIENMLKSNCMVVGSSMENASSTLREGMHLGVPCIASYRGGMTCLVEDGKDGFFYDFPEYQYLAGRINQVFESNELASELSTNAIKKAERWHDRDKNTNDYLSIYRRICCEKER